MKECRGGGRGSHCRSPTQRYDRRSLRLCKRLCVHVCAWVYLHVYMCALIPRHSTAQQNNNTAQRRELLFVPRARPRTDSHFGCTTTHLQHIVCCPGGNERDHGRGLMGHVSKMQVRRGDEGPIDGSAIWFTHSTPRRSGRRATTRFSLSLSLSLEAKRYTPDFPGGVTKE